MGERGGVTGDMIMDNGVNNVNFMGKLKNIFKDLENLMIIISDYFQNSFSSCL